MKRTIYILIFALLSLPFIAGGCRGVSNKSVCFSDTLYMPEYAVGFVMFGSGRSSVISVRDPWQGARGVEMPIFLSRDGEQPPEGFGGKVIHVPLKRVICMSSSYIAFVDALGEIDAVKGVSGVRYIGNDTIRSRHARGEIRDVGYDSSMDFEAIAALRPDLVMIYGVYGDNSTITGKLDELGINYMYVGDYVEQTPLGKAEWLVAFGEMFDRREQAAEMFSGIESEYNRVKELARRGEMSLSSNRPKVMLNAPYRDTWFVPGDRSYMARLIDDACGDYVCKGVDSEQSRPISGESAYVFAMRSDVWLNPGQAASMAEVVALNPRFSEIPPVINSNVYNCTKRSTPDGGSDFWESGAVRPDVVLKDMVRMLYPQFLPGQELYYFKKLD